MGGIYKIVNMINHKIYIGSAKNLNKRWSRHKNSLNKNTHHNTHLQRAWNKYGADSFQFAIIEETKDLLEREQYWIDTLKPKYNIGSVGGGDNISSNPNKEQFIDKQHHIQKQRWQNMSFEEKECISNKFKKENNPNWQGGKTYFTCPKCGKTIRTSVKQETCKQCRDFNGAKNSFYGKHHSNETKEKLRQNQLGKKPTNSKKILINNIVYNSYADAAKALGISNSLITYRIKIGVYTAMSPNDNLGQDL